MNRSSNMKPTLAQLTALCFLFVVTAVCVAALMQALKF